MKNLVLSAFVLLVVLSCDKKQVYKDFETGIQSERWSEKDVKVHEFEIDTDNRTYNVFIEISHVLGTEMNEFPVLFEVVKPDGTIEKGEVLVNFKKSECLGDVCDVKFLVKEKIKLNKGKYKVSFSPKSNFGYVPNIIGVGLSVEVKE